MNTVLVVVVVIDPCHVLNITAQGRWVTDFRGLGSETEEELRWGGDVRVEVGLMTVCIAFN